MPGSTGTGYPHTFRCAKCKRLRDYKRGTGRQGTNLDATGRVKHIPEHRNGGLRCLWYLAEYRCRDCGHVGWSKHGNMKMRLKKLFKTDPKKWAPVEKWIEDARPSWWRY